GIEHAIHDVGEVPVEAGRGVGAAIADQLGVDHGRVCKTLVVDVDGRLGVAVVPVDEHLDLRAAAAALGGKRAVMALPATAERATGSVPGGISPLGQRRRLPTVIDDTAFDHPTIFVSGGRRGLELELRADDLATALAAVRAPITGPRGGPSR